MQHVIRAFSVVLTSRICGKDTCISCLLEDVENLNIVGCLPYTARDQITPDNIIVTLAPSA